MLQGQNIEWEEVWDTFKIGFATPVDYNTRFRMIIGDLATRSKRGEGGENNPPIYCQYLQGMLAIYNIHTCRDQKPYIP